MMKSTSLLGIAFIVFLVWIFFASMPEYRLERACKPVNWFGNLTESFISLTIPDKLTATTEIFHSLEYSCQYALWRLFYEADFLEQQRYGSEGNNDYSNES